VKWFKHDSDAHRDAKLKKVLIKYGMTGYGLYWYCLEEIANNISETKFTFELESDAEIIAHDTGISTELASDMMTFMVNLGLFENNDGVITCLKMLNRLDQSMTSNKQMRNIISKAKSGLNHDSVMTQSCPEEKRLEEIRLEDNKNKSSPKVSDPVPYKKIVDLYHEMLPDLPKVEKLTGTRKAQIRQRWKQDLPDMDEWIEFFKYVSASRFLMGKSQPINGRRPFIANLEWLTKEANFVKIAEENYHG